MVYDFFNGGSIIFTWKVCPEALHFWAGMQGDGDVGGECPRGGCPDDDGSIFETEFATEDRECDKDGCAGDFLVFHFGFGQGGVSSVRPLNWFAALINGSHVNEFGKNAQDGSLVGRIHRQIGMIPIAKDPQTAEGVALDIDKFFGKLRTTAADFRRVEIPGFLDDFKFDRQAVAVPAGDVGGKVSGHGLGFDDHVLENFVEGCAHMDVAIGEGRAVMKNERRGVLFLASLDKTA